MDINSLLVEAEKLGVFLYVEDQKLKYKATIGTLPTNLREQLKTYKPAIIDRLTAAYSAKEQGFSEIKKRESNASPLLSFAQQRMWFLNQYMGPNAVYNIPLLLQFDRELNAQALLESLRCVGQRQASLRTRFKASGDSCEPILGLDLSLGRPERFASQAAAMAICHDEARYCFDLAKDPLCRARLLRVEDSGEFYLVAVFHHAIFDGWSKALFIEELKSNYQHIVDGTEHSLAPLAIDYQDYACWQRENAGKRVIADQLDYWRQQLKGLPPVMNLPLDRPRPAKQSFGGQTLQFELSLKTTENLELLARDQGATVFMLLHSIFSLLLSRYSGETDIAIGTTIANRTQQHLEEIIGFFINTLVLRSR